MDTNASTKRDVSVDLTRKSSAFHCVGRTLGPNHARERMMASHDPRIHHCRLTKGEHLLMLMPDDASGPGTRTHTYAERNERLCSLDVSSLVTTLLDCSILTYRCMYLLRDDAVKEGCISQAWGSLWPVVTQIDLLI